MLPGISTMKGTRCRVNLNYSSSTLSPYKNRERYKTETFLTDPNALMAFNQYEKI